MVNGVRDWWEAYTREEKFKQQTGSEIRVSLDFHDFLDSFFFYIQILKIIKIKGNLSE